MGRAGHGGVEAALRKGSAGIHGGVEVVVVVHHHDAHTGCGLRELCLPTVGPSVARNRIGRSVAVHVGRAHVSNVGGACLRGVHVLKDHLDGKADLGQVHDAAQGHAGCTDDLGLEEDVELRHFRVAGNGAVGGALKGLHGVVGELSCVGVVVVDGARGRDVVGEGPDLFGDGGFTRHDVGQIGDVPGVVVSLSGGGRPVFFGFRAVRIGADGVLGVACKGLVDHVFDGSCGRRRNGGDVQQDQHDSGNQHVSG